MAHSKIAVCLIKISKLLKKLKRTVKNTLHELHRNLKLSAVVIHLKHILDALNLYHIIKRKPFCGHYLIRWLIMVDNTIFRGMLKHIRTLEYL